MSRFLYDSPIKMRKREENLQVLNFSVPPERLADLLSKPDLMYLLCLFTGPDGDLREGQRWQVVPVSPWSHVAHKLNHFLYE